MTLNIVTFYYFVIMHFLFSWLVDSNLGIHRAAITPDTAPDF